MDTSAFLGMYAVTVGLVFFFTSGAFSMLSVSIGTIFQGVGIVFVYIGVALILWNILSSLNIFLESYVKRS